MHMIPIENCLSRKLGIDVSCLKQWQVGHVYAFHYWEWYYCLGSGIGRRGEKLGTSHAIGLMTSFSEFSVNLTQFFFILQMCRFKDEAPLDWEDLEVIYEVEMYSKVCISPDEGRYVASVLVSYSSIVCVIAVLLMLFIIYNLTFVCFMFLIYSVEMTWIPSIVLDLCLDSGKFYPQEK